MDHPAIFSATLGLSHPWHIVTVTFAREGNRMDISLDFYQGNSFTCPHCGKSRPLSSAVEELWFHEDFFRYPTYLHARVPRIECCRGVMATERPWTRTGSRFARVPEDRAAGADDRLQDTGPAGTASTAAGRPENHHSV